jgi:hypothetical protein
MDQKETIDQLPDSSVVRDRSVILKLLTFLDQLPDIPNSYDESLELVNLQLNSHSV